MQLMAKRYKSPAKAKIPKPKIPQQRAPEAMPDRPARPTVPKKLGSKSDYIPPWYKGERGAFASTKAAMQGVTKLPKMK